MKRLLCFSLLISATALSAQSFEWDKPTPATHPKEVTATPTTYASAAEIREGGLAGIYDKEADGTTTAYGEIYRANELTGSHPVLPLGTLLRVTNIENGRSVVVRVTDRGKECPECVVTLSNTAARELGMDNRSEVTIQPDGFSNWNPVPHQDVASAAEVSAPVAEEVVPPSAVLRPASATDGDERPSVFTREVVAPAPAPAISEAPKGEPVAYEQTVTPPSPTVAPGKQQARGVTEEVALEQESFAIQLAAYTNETYAVRRVQELKDQGMEDVYYRSVTKEDGEVINRVYSGSFDNVTDAQTAVRTIAGKYKLTGIVSKL
ncbi:septal ring lytic transglycosylase RlpA family protein [Lewinella sp. IMCC34191]|uniref:septal ring lytic transglycosylase RlpA family protein n=1 Tax=Lewinella sp. IMCC34191 TaxID=2259172 RepID=UPI000E2259BA|nr:RlpA-like double-psi beta-barrel domain-containing protein [Lewinella sp. IMCC34191]